jgi:hypothetical protein
VLWVQDVTGVQFFLMLYLLLFKRKKERKQRKKGRNSQGTFSQGWYSGIFPAVRCN